MGMAETQRNILMGILKDGTEVYVADYCKDELLIEDTIYDTIELLKEKGITKEDVETECNHRYISDYLDNDRDEIYLLDYDYEDLLEILENWD